MKSKEKKKKKHCDKGVSHLYWRSLSPAVAIATGAGSSPLLVLEIQCTISAISLCDLIARSLQQSGSRIRTGFQRDMNILRTMLCLLLYLTSMLAIPKYVHLRCSKHPVKLTLHNASRSHICTDKFADSLQYCQCCQARALHDTTICTCHARFKSIGCTQCQVL